MRQLKETYIREGKVRFGYLHFIVKGEESQWAAEASECAAEQGEQNFWTYHDKLFEITTGDRQPPFTKDNLKQFAIELGLEPQAFNTCLDSGKHMPDVREDTRSGFALGFQATPSFLINGQPLVGAQPFKVFQEYIEAGLER